MPNPTTTTTIPQYRIQIRDHALIPLGELARGDLLDGDVVLNFNDVGAFALTINADSPMATHFAAGNGIIISRDRGDGSGAETLISGPFWHLERRLQDNTYVLAGPDDLFWLKARTAWPVTSAPNYSAIVLADTPAVYLRLGEASGTTAADSSGNGRNATYFNSPTLGVTSLVDDANTAATFNGTTQYVATNAATGVPSGNAVWTQEVWFQANSAPASTVALASLGVGGNNALVSLLLQGDMNVRIDLFGIKSATSAAPLTLGVPHHAVGTYDGAALTLFLDGMQVASVAASALALTSGPWFLASRNSGGGVAAVLFPGTLDECALYSTVLSATSIQAHYLRGLARFAASAYDTRTNTASTAIRQYVDVNAGPSAVLERRVTGLSLAADPAIGTTVTGNERFDNLLVACQQLALSGGDIGFRMIQTDVGALTFTLYAPAVQSNAIFSRELGNLLDAVYTLDGPVANQYVIGGGGEGILRAFTQGQDNGSMATWGRVEGFMDARDTSDVATMQQRIGAQLAQDAEQTNLTITPVDTPALQFGRDYNLGDIVTVQIDGATITDKIRQLHIQLNSTDQELVTPGIGNAGAGQIAHLFDARARALSRVQQMVARLQAAQ